MHPQNRSNIPPEGFEKLIDVIDLLGYTNNNIKIINKNLPKEYDLSKFPKKILNKLIIIAGYQGDAIRMWNVQKNKSINDWWHGSVYSVECLCTSPDNKRSIAGHGNGKIKIWNCHMDDKVERLQNKLFSCPPNPYDRYNNAIIDIFFLPCAAPG